MSGGFVVDNVDANNFVVRRVGETGRYVFHVVPIDARRRALSPAAWTKGANASGIGHADCFLHEAQAFARGAAQQLGLIT
jgi:hypothetical protein